MRQPKFIDLRGFLSFQILHELSKKPLCGDELAAIIGQRKGAKLTPGTIYPALKALRKTKLVQHKKTGRKKMYRLTQTGTNEYKISRDNLESFFKNLLKK
ncbi:winged helix-turn-helix transcriptional regulator [Candidatus Woesearchaeota archaeon]|nr:winged helix-turn-helix transcriptional regulator [Candidatus Woesearchaeota archaeon]